MSTPTPATTSITIEKPTDDAEDKTVNSASFGPIKFEKAGTYNYTVKETKGSLGGVVMVLPSTANQH